MVQIATKEVLRREESLVRVEKKKRSASASVGKYLRSFY
jgi:hypothetical protein